MYTHFASSRLRRVAFYAEADLRRQRVVSRLRESTLGTPARSWIGFLATMRRRPCLCVHCSCGMTSNDMLYSIRPGIVFLVDVTRCTYSRSPNWSSYAG